MYVPAWQRAPCATTQHAVAHHYDSPFAARCGIAWRAYAYCTYTHALHAHSGTAPTHAAPTVKPLPAFTNTERVCTIVHAYSVCMSRTLANAARVALGGGAAAATPKRGLRQRLAVARCVAGRQAALRTRVDLLHRRLRPLHAQNEVVVRVPVQVLAGLFCVLPARVGGVWVGGWLVQATQGKPNTTPHHTTCGDIHQACMPQAACHKPHTTQATRAPATTKRTGSRS